MIDIAWMNEERHPSPKKYLIPWNDDQSRQAAFLSGWTTYLDNDRFQTEALHWYTVGAFFASILGDIPVDQRRQIYYGALADFLKSESCSAWTQEEREQALQFAREAPGVTVRTK